MVTAFNNPIFIILIGILPSVVWLIFFLREDMHPEPKKLIIYTFGVGAVISLPVFVVEYLYQNALTSITSNAILMVIGLSLIEEIFKFLAAYWAINGSPYFDEPVDAMIYMLTAALGFAAVENIFVASSTPDVFQGAGTTSLRFVGATLLHALASALVGYYWARGIIKKSLLKQIALGIVIATAFHSLFNYIILKFQDNNLAYSTIVIFIAAFFVFTDFEKLKERAK